MKFSVISTVGHQDKTLIVDADLETVAVQDPSGKVLGDMPWGEIIERVLAGDDTAFAHCRAYPRAPLRCRNT
ncbi:MAG: hypothetical protein HP494_08505 [Nitrospira sp.]|nr:hypothetical protein [Nitrospira sp.]